MDKIVITSDSAFQLGEVARPLHIYVIAMGQGGFVAVVCDQGESLKVSATRYGNPHDALRYALHRHFANLEGDKRKQIDEIVASLFPA